ncbi:MAG: dTDP-4-dehydrorhamnose reductase [Bacteroidales bacterium]|nr:dTDP-4-dehydrorhamnose reductase [Bacteroidales bacterium]
MKIVVTGALGQLGQEIMKLAAGSEHEFVFTDIRATDNVSLLDITDADAVDAFVGKDVDVIVNCAAYTDVNKAESDEESARQINAAAAGILASAAAKADALLIHVSTDYVFDGTSTVPYREDCLPAPTGAYGRTKLEGERLVQESGCRYMIFRTAWLYSLSGRNFFLTMVNKTAELPQMKVVFDQTGTPTYAGDLAYLISHIIENGLLDRTGIYHYTDEGVCSWYDFAKEINSLVGHTCNVMPCRTEDYPTPARRPHYSVLDKAKVRETFGIEIPHWRDSLVMAVNEYMNTEE